MKKSNTDNIREEYFLLKEGITYIPSVPKEELKPDGDLQSIPSSIKKHYLANHLYKRKEPEFIMLTADDIRHSLANLNQITFEVTESCNLNCHYCGYGTLYSDYDQRKGRNLDTQAAINLLDYLISLWNSGFNTSQGKIIFISFYGGEPLLNMPFIHRIVDYMSTVELKHNQVIFSMTTNGILLKKNIAFLVEHDFKLLISLDGDENHNSYRTYKNGKSAFEDTYANIVYIQNNYPAYFKKRVEFNSVLHNRNNVSDIVRYIQKEFGKTPSIAALSTSGINPSKKEEYTKMYKNFNESLCQSEDYEEIKKELAFKASENMDLSLFLVSYGGIVFDSYNDLFINKKGRKRTPTGTCVPFGKKMFVTVTGKILPCEKIGHQFSLGQILERKINLDPESIAKKYNNYYEKIKPLCSKCYNADECLQCLFNFKNPEKPVCAGFLNEAVYRYAVNKNMQSLQSNKDICDKIINDVIIHI